MSVLRVQKIRHTASNTDVIDIANDGTCRANIINKPNRNLLINGACLIAQRGVSDSSNSGGMTVDRFGVYPSGTDEAPTQEQVDVASGTTPYTLGFRKALKITNGNQTSGAGAGDNLRILYKVEAQDLANSGWNYTSASSYITLSFWVKSSVSQNFYVQFRTKDGTEQNYTFETGTLTQNTWTKITKTIPGNSNLTFNNDNGVGLEINFWQFAGTDLTGSMTLNQWAAYSGSARMPDMTSTWYTTNDATFEVTGFQLEVSDHATDFEHKLFTDELLRCQRYHWRVPFGNESSLFLYGGAYASGSGFVRYSLPVKMRATPTFTYTDVRTTSGLSLYNSQYELSVQMNAENAYVKNPKLDAEL